MSDELDCVRRLRPPVEPASSQARKEALLGLERAIATEQAALDASTRRARFRAGRGHATRPRSRSLDGVVIDDAHAGERARPQRSVSGLGAVLSSLAVIVALVIAGGALVLIRHGRTGSGSRAPLAAARGAIVDRSGNVLAGDRPVFDVQIDAAALPSSTAMRAAEYKLLARLLGISNMPERCTVPGHGVRNLTPIECAVTHADATQRVTIASDVSDRILFAVSEETAELAGVSIKRASYTLRSHPFGSLAAQVLGTVGPITQAEARTAGYQGVPATAIVGHSGLEYSYDSYLRGGQNLRLALDVRLQSVGEAALAHAISQNPPASGGAFVAINPQNGEIYAMGSNPTFNPAVFTHPLPAAAYSALTSPTSGFPLLNRAIDSAGPTGSTFKPITAIAALQSGAWLPDETFDDTGQFCIKTECRHNAGHASDGVLDLANALRVSEDLLFYDLGARMNANPLTHPNGGALQQWARALGIGQATGIDLPGEATGTLPTPAWHAHRNELEQQCESATGPYEGRPMHPAADGGCGIATIPPETWTVGDNINLAVGQGDVQLTPLQLAVAYAALANGGMIVRPHLALDIESPSGTVMKTIDPSPLRHLDFNDRDLGTVQQGLRAASDQPAGTTFDVFGDFPEPVYGESGSAQYNGQQNYAWYAGYVPASATTSPIVVVVTVEQGGFGAHTAAPVARQILSQWYLGKPGPWQPGHANTL